MAEVKADIFYKTYLGIETPFPHQRDFWDLALSNKFPILVKAPTGSGKTEMVIAAFLRQFVEGKFIIAPRLIYVLPMRVLVNTLSERIKKYVNKISPSISVKIQHGDVPNAPFFMADIVVTTLDQFLYGFARSSKQVGKHIDIPAGAIASSLVVFDEAHMYRDEFTFSILRALLEILYQSRIPFVVMTATMPDSLEKSLFENINIFDEQKIIGDLLIESEVKINLAKAPMYDSDEVNLSKEILEKIEHNKTLVVANQVKRAQRIYDEIKKRLSLNDNQIVLLHSRFTKRDRELHENKAFSLLPHKENGKTVVSKETGVIVSTQVLEAGIDFSAELLLTEIAPADALIQRAGRCARYKGENGEMIIFPVEENKGYKPYEENPLKKTLEWLEKHPNFNIKDFSQTSEFVNILDYKANDYEARDTLIDLYECVLYADEMPRNIQLRSGKPIYLLVVDLAKGEGKGKEERINNAIAKTNIRETTINVDIGVGWKLKKDKVITSVLDFDRDKKCWVAKEIREVAPFSYYLLDINDYDHLKGIKPDVGIFI